MPDQQSVLRSGASRLAQQRAYFDLQVSRRPRPRQHILPRAPSLDIADLPTNCWSSPHSAPSSPVLISVACIGSTLSQSPASARLYVFFHSKKKSSLPLSLRSHHIRSGLTSSSQFQHAIIPASTMSWFQFPQAIISSPTQLQNSRLARLPGLTTACIATCTTPAAFSPCFSLPNLFSTLIQFVPHHQPARFTVHAPARSLHGSSPSPLASRFKPQPARFTAQTSARSLYGPTLTSLASPRPTSVVTSSNFSFSNLTSVSISLWYFFAFSISMVPLRLQHQSNNISAHVHDLTHFGYRWIYHYLDSASM